MAYVTLIVGGYLVELPLAAEVVAWAMPESAKVIIGREALLSSINI